MNIFSSSKDPNHLKYKLKKIIKDRFILYSHLGLGDQIILNGMVNHISENQRKVILLSKEKFKINMDYLYKNNKNVELLYFPENLNHLDQSDPSHEEFVLSFAKKNNLEVLKVGYEKVGKTPFYEAFYKQLNLDYKISYEKFNFSVDHLKEKDLYEKMSKVYGINYKNFNIIHRQHSSGNIEIRNIPNSNNLFVDKETDPFNNLFLYRDLILKAKEIHCINSSFAHFVDRVKTPADLYYHDVIGSRLRFSQNWKFIDKNANN